MLYTLTKSYYLSQQLSLQDFISSYLNSPLTSLFYLLLSICHINECEIFCVYRLSLLKNTKPTLDKRVII